MKLIQNLGTPPGGGGGGGWGGGVELIYFRTRPQVNKKVPNYMRFFGVFGVGSDFFWFLGLVPIFPFFYYFTWGGWGSEGWFCPQVNKGGVPLS